MSIIVSVKINDGVVIAADRGSRWMAKNDLANLDRD
jgi:20S proteasome alpha/beta subunit